jgi:membrane protein implicated in regulation of membrane protease activity
VQRTGIGPVLREARLRQGKSIEEASRETRIRSEYLQALERESYETFEGDVYIRGFLRTYSAYLGLDADRVLVEFNEHFGPPTPTLPAPAPGPPKGEKTAQPHLFPLRRYHPSWRFLIAMAVVVIALLAAAGVFRSRSSPPAGTVAGGSQATAGPTVQVAITAVKPVHVVLTVDGKSQTHDLDATEGIAVTGQEAITVEITPGGRATVTVNGHSLGKPGHPTRPFVATYTPQDYRRSPSSPTPNKSAGHSP